jgi:hypothetical protein
MSAWSVPNLPGRVELIPVSEKPFLFLGSQTPSFALKVMGSWLSGYG